MVDEPKPTRKNSKGVQLYAPAGGSVWNSPTIDTKLNAIYFGTGDAETEPAAKTSDAVMALDLKTGKELWHYQIQENDAFMGGCGPNKSENCPVNPGPDLDIGNSPILKTMPDGKRILLTAAKDGRVFALDPDKKGALLWMTNAAPPPPPGSCAPGPRAHPPPSRSPASSFSPSERWGPGSWRATTISIAGHRPWRPLGRVAGGTLESERWIHVSLCL